MKTALCLMAGCLLAGTAAHAGTVTSLYGTIKEVAPDPSQNGQIGYRNSTGGFLTEVSASEHILARILR
jgi:hypothetical protein